MIRNNKESIDIELNLEAKETINKLEKIKRLCKEINEIENKNIDYVETRYYTDNKITKVTTIKYK